MNQVEQLRFYNFNTGNPGVFKTHCENAFRLWEAQWTETFLELNVNKTIFSDEFLNREIGGLFLGDQPVGFILYTFLDLSRYSNQRVLYAENYPTELWQNYCEKEDLVMVAGNMTVASEWRKSKTNYPVSEVLFSLAVLRFLSSDASRIITYARNNRKMNEMVYRHGGVATLANHEAYNVAVDFIEIARDAAQISQFSNCAPITLNLWNPNQQPLITETNYGLTTRKPENGKTHRLHEPIALGK